MSTHHLLHSYSGDRLVNNGAWTNSKILERKERKKEGRKKVRKEEGKKKGRRERKEEGGKNRRGKRK